MSNRPISEFLEKYYLHFNAAALVDASKGYVAHLKDGGKMMITLAGAMSTAEMGKILAEMIRQDKVQIISCTGANLEEDVELLEQARDVAQVLIANKSDVVEQHLQRWLASREAYLGV
jgi:deoxyhypusine synthase